MLPMIHRQNIWLTAQFPPMTTPAAGSGTIPIDNPSPSGSFSADNQPEVAADDSALFPPRNDQDLGAGEPLPHLVRDRGPCLRRAGGAGRGPEGGEIGRAHV